MEGTRSVEGTCRRQVVQGSLWELWGTNEDVRERLAYLPHKANERLSWAFMREVVAVRTGPPRRAGCLCIRGFLAERARE